jgi:hypothetical protein
VSAAPNGSVVTGSPRLQKKGGYPAGDKPVSQLTPPPASMTGKSKTKKSG